MYLLSQRGNSLALLRGRGSWGATGQRLSLQVLTQSLNKARGLFHSYRVPLVPGSAKQLRACILCRSI